MIGDDALAVGTIDINFNTTEYPNIENRTSTIEINSYHSTPYTIYCQSNNICKIFCDDSSKGCINLNLYCYGTCLIDCSNGIPINYNCSFNLQYGNYSEWIYSFEPTTIPTNIPSNAPSLSPSNAPTGIPSIAP